MKLVYTFLYIEDDKSYQEKFMGIVNHYFKKRGIEVYWETYSYIPDVLDCSVFDAFFLDIEVGESTTLELLKDNQINVPIIFITQYSSYIYESVHFHIFDYLRKSQLEDEIDHTLQHLEKFYEYYDDQFIIKYNGSIYRIKIGDINYINTLSHRTIIHKYDGEKIDIWKGYKQIFSRNYKGLIRIHKSYVVNLYNCQKIRNRYMYFTNSEKPIPISNRKYKEVQELFLKILLGK